MVGITRSWHLVQMRGVVDVHLKARSATRGTAISKPPASLHPRHYPAQRRIPEINLASCVFDMTFSFAQVMTARSMTSDLA